MDEKQGSNQESANILKSVGIYYSEKISSHGATPAGVDWNGEESQTERFHQLLKIVTERSPFSILDYGCGYGAILDSLNLLKTEFNYIGYDLSDAMLNQARIHYSHLPKASFVGSLTGVDSVDYVVASGIMNVRLETNCDQWSEYVEGLLDKMNAICTKGFSFNMLTSYSDKEYMRDYLYYADPCHIFDLCKRKYSRNVALLHDYGLYEFTVLVRK